MGGINLVQVVVTVHILHRSNGKLHCECGSEMMKKHIITSDLLRFRIS
jgi:hypothetical protein